MIQYHKFGFSNKKYLLRNCYYFGHVVTRLPSSKQSSLDQWCSWGGTVFGSGRGEQVVSVDYQHPPAPREQVARRLPAAHIPEQVGHQPPARSYLHRVAAGLATPLVWIHSRQRVIIKKNYRNCIKTQNMSHFTTPMRSRAGKHSSCYTQNMSSFGTQ